MNKYFIALTLLSTAMTTSIANAAMIDDFGGGDQIIWSESSGSVSYGAAFGGNRKIEITSDGYSDEASAKVRNGVFKHNADSGISATSTISWATSGGSFVDLTDDDTSYGFALDVLSIDQGNVDFTLSVSDILGGFGDFTFQDAGIGVQFIAFTSFTSLWDIDFSQVNEISLRIEGDIASDLTLDSISTVPAPPAVILFTSGLAALGFSRRKLIA